MGSDWGSYYCWSCFLKDNVWWEMSCRAGVCFSQLNGLELSLEACDALNLQDCNLAACMVALPQYFNLIECFLHLSSMTRRSKATCCYCLETTCVSARQSIFWHAGEALFLSDRCFISGLGDPNDSNWALCS